MLYSPEEVFRQALQAAYTHDAAAIIALAEPESLIRLIDDLKEHGLRAALEPDRTIASLDDPRRPGTADVVASYRSYAAQERERLERDYGVATRSDLQRLSPLELLSGAVRSVRKDIQEHFPVHIIGQLLRGERAYVFFQHEPESDHPPNCAVLRRVGGEWKLVLSFDSEVGVPGIPGSGWGYVRDWPSGPDDATA